MTKLELDGIVQRYYDRLEYDHPPVRSQKFVDNSIAKWACAEILRDIRLSYDLPFHLSTLEILEGFVNKMNNYACLHKNEKGRYRFSKAADIGESFIEEYWRYENRKGENENV